MKKAPGAAMKPILWMAILVLSASCAAEPVRRVTGRPTGTRPWRIAVLPAQLGPEIRRKADGRMDEKMAEYRKALDEIRECVALRIPGDLYEVISLPLVDRIVAPGTVLTANPETLKRAARALRADLLLVPEIYSWRRRYYLIHAESRVGITARIYDASSGKLLFESMHEQARNQGLLKIPAGPFAAVAGPIVGLQGIYMADMCQRTSGEIGKDMKAFPDTPTEGQAGASTSAGRGAPPKTPAVGSSSSPPR